MYHGIPVAVNSGHSRTISMKGLPNSAPHVNRSSPRGPFQNVKQSESNEAHENVIHPPTQIPHVKGIQGLPSGKNYCSKSREPLSPSLDGQSKRVSPILSSINLSKEGNSSNDELPLPKEAINHISPLSYQKPEMYKKSTQTYQFSSPTSSNSPNVIHSNLPTSTKADYNSKLTSSNSIARKSDQFSYQSPSINTANKRTYIRSNSDSKMCITDQWSPEERYFESPQHSPFRKRINSGELTKDLPAQHTTTGKTSHSIYHKPLPFSYTKYKPTGNVSDTETDNVMSFRRKKVHGGSVQNLSELGDTYNYVDDNKISRDNRSVNLASMRSSGIPYRHENKLGPPFTRRDVKSSIVVNGNVPSLLKTCPKENLEKRTECNVTRVREVEKIINQWEVERIIQNGSGKPVTPVRTIHRSNQRIVERQVSSHREEQSLGNLVDMVTTLTPGKFVNDSNPRTFPYRSDSSQRNFCSSSSPEMKISKGAPTLPVRGGSIYKLSREIAPVGTRSSYRHSISRNSGSFPSKNENNAISSLSVPKNENSSLNSSEMITIDSLMEQLKALS